MSIYLVIFFLALRFATTSPCISHNSVGSIVTATNLHKDEDPQFGARATIWSSKLVQQIFFTNSSLFMGFLIVSRPFQKFYVVFDLVRFFLFFFYF